MAGRMRNPSLLSSKAAGDHRKASGCSSRGGVNSVWEGRRDREDEPAYIQRMLEFSGECSNKECHFLHTNTAFKTQDCPWYDQGFCKDGEALKEWEQRGMRVTRMGGLPVGRMHGADEAPLR